jgi:predicted nucleic acid-binding protein
VYLFDTSVLSALAPDRPAVSTEFQHWVAKKGEAGELFISTVVVVELQKGLANLKRKGALAKAARLEAWLEILLGEFENRALPLTTEIARDAGSLEDLANSKGRNPGLADILIASTARIHGLKVLTANVRHFAPLGVAHANPLSGDLQEL